MRERKKLYWRKIIHSHKKKVERTVLIERPIGALQEISKGRVWGCLLGPEFIFASNLNEDGRDAS